DRGPAVTMRLVDQRSVTSRDPGVKDQSNVHHNVDEVGILAVKRTEATSPLVESHCQRSAGMDRSFQERIVGKALTDRCFIPPPVAAVIKDEAEVVNLAVVLAVLDASRIRLGKPAPRRFAGLIVKYPHHARKEAVAPRGPQLTRVAPFAIPSIERIES